MSTEIPAPEPSAELLQIEKYDFKVRFPGKAFPPIEVDESPPTGGDRGPDPTRMLAAAVGHCMSSTFYNCLERSRVGVHPVTTSVRLAVGRNPKGRRRVLSMEVSIETAPLREDERERFEHCVSIFEEYCTVSGAVREGIRISTEVRPPVGPASESGAP